MSNTPMCSLPTDIRPTRPLRRWPRLATGFGLDLTGLALVRILTAIWLLIDLGQRAAGFTFLQVDGGAFPRAALIADSGVAAIGFDLSGWTLHLLTGSIELQGVALVIAALAQVTLLVGWQTRISALISGILLVSLAHRTPLAALPMDALLALLTWWCAVLPVGARLSLDAARRAPGGPPKRLAGSAGWGFLASMALCSFALFQQAPGLESVLHGGCALAVLLMAVVPHAWWRRIPALWKRPSVTIWIDGNCGICTRAGRLLTQIHGGQITLRLIQEDAEIQALSDAQTSWVVDCDGARFLGWAGVRAMLNCSPWLWPCALPLPWPQLNAWAGEKLYATIATNRHRPWWNWMAPMLPEEPLPSSVLLPTVMLLVAVWMVPGANGLIARNALGLACVSDPGPGLLTAPATWPDGSVTDLRTGGGVVVPEPATHLPEVYHEFSSGRTRAHLARLTHHPIAARAYLDYLLRLSSARTHLTLTHAELRVFEFTASGWRSRLIAASP